MSTENIFRTTPIRGGRVLVSFNTRTGMRHYLYAAKAAQKILKGADPADFKGTEIRTEKDK